MNGLSSAEIDQAGRKGLDHIIAFFDGGKDAQTEKKAEMGVKVIGLGRKQKNAEINAISTQLRTAKAAGVTESEQREIYENARRLTSGEMLIETTASLASIESSGSGADRQNDKRKGRRAA